MPPAGVGRGWEEGRAPRAPTALTPAALVSTRGHPGLLPAALQDREPLGLITTHLHPLWAQLVQAATRAGSVVNLKLIPVTVDGALIAPGAPELGSLLFQPVPPTVCSYFSVR